MLKCHAAQTMWQTFSAKLYKGLATVLFPFAESGGLGGVGGWGTIVKIYIVNHLEFQMTQPTFLFIAWLKTKPELKLV